MKRSLILLLTFLALSIGVDAKNVKGTVQCGTDPLGGVIVTDGTNFAKTDAKGTFKLKLSDATRFIYIVTPSGYVADFSSGVPQFYQKYSENQETYHFQVSRTSGPKDYHLFSVSDPQMKPGANVKQFEAEPLQDLIAQAKEYSSDAYTVGIALGDIASNQQEIYPGYKADIVKTGIPFYSVIGNHDHVQNASGDATTKAYEDSFGPLDYAFFIGNDIVIGLDNIIFWGSDTTKALPSEWKNYVEGYSEATIAWVKGLLKYVPVSCNVFVAQHATIYRWWEKKEIYNGGKLLAALQGYHVDFLEGHSHIQNNIQFSGMQMEHNAASICGAWWTTKLCNDGTPRGYEIFTKKEGKLSWLYHPIDYPDSYQFEMFGLGQSEYHPNSIVVNIWDYTPQWSVEWEQDGVRMGDLKQVEDISPDYVKEINAYATKTGKPLAANKLPRKNIHYFTATPSQYAKKVTVIIKDPFGHEWSQDYDMSSYVDVQAHRGGAGLMPENTFNSMENALKLGVNTLEMDLQISGDSVVVVSHDNYFHSRYATRPDGSLVQANDPKEYLYKMPYDSIALYDVGLRPNDVWPQQKKVAAVKPKASDLIDYVERYTSDNDLSPVRYNIEIKSRAGKGEGVNWPEYHKFVDECVALLKSKHLGDRLVIQCFDVRALEYMHQKYPELYLSYLVDPKCGDFDTYMSKLSFTPAWLSPEQTQVTPDVVKKCHERGMKIVPWTIDEPSEMQRMFECGVDAIISNYPDKVLEITRGY